MAGKPKDWNGEGTGSGGPRPNSGGPRPNARRKPKPVPTVLDPSIDMLSLLKGVAAGTIVATPIQVRAAIAAVQYTHIKKGDGGKKEEAAENAKKAASKFPRSTPPKLVPIR